MSDHTLDWLAPGTPVIAAHYGEEWAATYVSRVSPQERRVGLADRGGPIAPQRYTHVVSPGPSRGRGWIPADRLAVGREVHVDPRWHRSPCWYVLSVRPATPEELARYQLASLGAEDAL